MFTLDQHRSIVLWHKDNGETDEIPVTYWDGSFWDKEMNEYTFAEVNKEYWDNYYKDQKVKRINIPSFDEYGNLKLNADGMPLLEWIFISPDIPKSIYDDMRYSRPTKEQWVREVWNVCMGRYQALRKEQV